MAQNRDDAYWANRSQELQSQYREFLTAHDVSIRGHDLESAINNMQVITMATRKVMAEIITEMSGESKGEQEAAKRAVFENRHHFLRHLWEHDLLDTPWRILIDQEFPGDPPTLNDFGRYIGEAAEQMLLSHAHQEKLNQLRGSIELLLESHAYEAGWEDGVTIMRLASLLAMSQVRIGELTVEDRRAMRQSAEQAIEEAREPAHPAWTMVLKGYFREL